jgi:FkbM family methyltransferase
MIEITKSIWTRNIDGINLTFEDVSASNTVPYVFGELQSDYYGLNSINLSKDDIVIDIGGNVGMFSIYVKKKFNCKVISFEPVPMNYEQFKINMVLNGLELNDIELHNKAITNVEGGEMKIGTNLYNTGGSSVYVVGDINSICETETIDKYITSGCKYLKIDCEGGEYDIIPSILDKLNQFDYIGIEYHKFNNQNPSLLHKLIEENFNGEIFYNK